MVHWFLSKVVSTSFFFFFFWSLPAARGILVPPPGIKLTSQHQKRNLNHWTTKEVPRFEQRFTCRKCEVKWTESRSVVSDSLQPLGQYTPWNSPGRNTGVDSLSFLQGNIRKLAPKSTWWKSVLGRENGKHKNCRVKSKSDWLKE